MIPGPSLVIRGAIFAATLLSLLLFAITANASYPPALPSEVILDKKVSAVGDIVSVSQAAVNPDDAGGKCSVSDQFPASVLQWCELITRYAARHSLPSDLVAALIWQESSGDPQAYSRSGAVGLMQIMPSDGQAASFECVNGPCFSNRPTTEELKDPEFNIAFGTRMLANLFAHSGNLRDALKSYGPMNVGYDYADKVMSLFRNYGQEVE